MEDERVAGLHAGDVGDEHPAGRAGGGSIAAALVKESEIGIPVAMSEDAREGPRAFKEKRKPVHKGR